MEQRYSIPEHAMCIDAGTSVREILFDLILSEKKPRKLIIVDADDSPNRTPGEIGEIDINRIRPEKASDFSLHQFPTTNMLKELKDLTSMEVRVFTVQVSPLPAEVRTGLSKEVQSAVPKMCALIMEEIESTTNERRALCSKSASDALPGGSASTATPSPTGFEREN